MSAPSSPAPRRHNRANWVGLRTLRQLPKVVDETSAGEPIVEVRGVRLVLRDGAGHFSRMATCSKCGREVPGAPVLGPTDLDHPAHPVICRDCVRTAAAPVLGPDRRTVAPAPEPAARAEPADGADAGALEPRVVAVEELVRRQRADWDAALEDRMEATRTELRSLAAKELARAQEDVDRMMKGVVERLGNTAGVDAGVLQALEERLNRTVERLSERLDDQRAELAADVDARLAQLRAALDDQRAAAGAQVDVLTLREELVEAHEELRQEVERLARSLADDEGSRRLDGVDARLQQLEEERIEAHEEVRQEVERLARTLADDEGSRRLDGVDARLQQLQEALDAVAARAGGETARIEEELGRRLDALAERAAPQARRIDDLEAGLQRLQETLDAQTAGIAGSTEKLSKLEKRLDTRVNSVDERVQASDGALAAFRGDVARIEAHVADRLDRQAERAARAAPDGGRLDALEARLDEAMERLGGLVESQRLQLEEGLRGDLAEARSGVAAVEKRVTTRLDTLEGAATARARELAELVDLQGALDAGLGELRSEIEQVRETARLAAHIDSRLGTLVDVSQLSGAEPERGRRGAKKSGDAMAGLTTAVQSLLEEHRRLRSQIATLENESETAVKASARASAQAMAVHPLRQDVRALRDEVATLAKAVETLRRAQAKPATTKAPAAAKATRPVAAKATKTPAAAKATKTPAAAKATKPPAGATKATKAPKATKKA